MIYRIKNNVDKLNVIGIIDKLSEKKRWEIDISVMREKRSYSQNSTYWMWLSCVEDETGNDKNDLHDHFRHVYLPSRTITILGQESQKTLSTTELSTLQFSDYMEKIRIFCATELGITLPDPETHNWEEFVDKYKNKL